MSTLTFEHLQKAYERMMKPPKRDSFKCKCCNKPNIFTGWEFTEKIEGYNYFICWPCAIFRSKNNNL